jgi:hypothetical protein
LWWWDVAELGVAVGVLFDYFRASDASTAAAVLERVGGPMTSDPDRPVLDAVAGKGFEPEVMMRTLQSLLTGIAYDELPEGELLATEGEDGPWILRCRRGFATLWRTRSRAGCQWLPSNGWPPRSSGTRQPRPRCCRFWARSPPWPVVHATPVSACTAGCAGNRG